MLFFFLFFIISNTYLCNIIYFWALASKSEAHWWRQIQRRQTRRLLTRFQCDGMVENVKEFEIFRASNPKILTPTFVFFNLNHLVVYDWLICMKIREIWALISEWNITSWWVPIKNVIFQGVTKVNGAASSASPLQSANWFGRFASLSPISVDGCSTMVRKCWSINILLFFINKSENISIWNIFFSVFGSGPVVIKTDKEMIEMLVYFRDTLQKDCCALEIGTHPDQSVVKW